VLEIRCQVALPYKDARRDLIEAFEEAYVHALMEKHGGNISAASREAALSRRHLRELLRKYDLWVPPESGA